MRDPRPWTPMEDEILRRTLAEQRMLPDARPLRALAD